MAPRALESLAQFAARLAREAAAGRREVRFGGHHFTHAVCLEEGVWRVRRLECTTEEIDAYQAAHRGFFMPESVEEISTPRTLVFEAPTVKAVVKRLRTLKWPP